MDVVVVESPTKARTIDKYVGGRYAVLASNGHIRDLPEKDGSVSPDDGFAMRWQVMARSEKNIASIVRAVKGAKLLYLATDPDREGEAISWHVRAVLAERAALRGVEVRRIVFHEVTETAVNEAIRQPRDLDQGLVDAYLARRALDYLVGFTLSPVLWRKLPGARSAGRVQSVALRLICEREAEIEVFRPQEYWSVEADFRTGRGPTVNARLTHLDGTKLERMAIADEAAAAAAVAEIDRRTYSVAKIEKKRVRRNPQPPFTTSTLQQEASRKLGLGASRTMRLAQKLYEGIDLGGKTVGLITYMRTDSVAIANEARDAIRRLIETDYGKGYVPGRPHKFRSRARNAQEAHEAIRPTDVVRRPSSVAHALERDEHRLYELIWTRAVASQMESASLEQVAVDIASDDRAVILRANGSVVLFDGFLRLYEEGRDDPAESEDGRTLPPMTEGESLERIATRPEQHFTKPPPRYTEASLVRKLEELGIGRPSTYAQILNVLRERDYVRLESRRFVPEDRGRIVTVFLSGFFNRYVEYNFTAELEKKLDEIARGERNWQAVLEEFWKGFSAAVSATSDLKIGDVIDALDKDLGPHFFPVDGENGSDPRNCPACGSGRLGLRLGRHGAFIGCSGYPDCAFTRSLTADPEAAAISTGPRILGEDPATGQLVTVRKGPYGFYAQAGETEGKKKPKRVSLPKGTDPEGVTLDQALGLLSLPRDVGLHPETGKEIVAGLGRYGPYLKYDGAYTSLGPDEDLLTIGLNRAVTLIAEAPKKGRQAKVLRALGDHPGDGKPIEIRSGRYGPYIAHGRAFASLPKNEEAETLTIARAVEILAARAKKGVAKPRTRAARGKTARKT